MMAERAPTDTTTTEASQVAAEAVSTQEFETAARATFRTGLAELLASPDPTVREAAVQLSDPNAREQAFDTLWSYANANPGPTQALIFRVCAAVAQAVNSPRAERFVEGAREANPDDANVWRLYSFNLRRQNRTEEAGAAALVGEGLDAQARGDAQVAEERLGRALPALRSSRERTDVESRLTRIRPDWRARRAARQATDEEQDQPAEQSDQPQTDQQQPTRRRTY
jgi:hypothetical protein